MTVVDTHNGLCGSTHMPFKLQYRKISPQAHRSITGDANVEICSAAHSRRYRTFVIVTTIHQNRWTHPQLHIKSKIGARDKKTEPLHNRVRLSMKIFHVLGAARTSKIKRYHINLELSTAPTELHAFLKIQNTIKCFVPMFQIGWLYQVIRYLKASVRGRTQTR